MLLILKAKLQPCEEQRRSLLKTMERFNAACNYISKAAFSSKTYNKVKLQRRLYYDIRKKYGLSAQLAIRAISKVVESYKVERNTLHEFDEHGAIVYDQRILSFVGLDKVSLNTVDGRLIIPMLIGAYAKLDERRIKGQADLIYVKGEFYLCIVVDVPEESPITPEGYLGVDLGVVNIATTSDGVRYTGEACDKTRTKYCRLKAGLQSTWTKSAKRRLRIISGRERRFKTSINHKISKEIVQAAKGTKRAIVLEDLTYIRSRTTVRHEQRERYSKWAFDQLRSFIEYKAKIAGVLVELIDGRNTSRQCSECGYIDKSNRHGQVFKCLACGHEENADLNAAKNIRQRAAVNRPIAVCPATGS
ncbi:RNA-guided endonuclease InsQ/TnpB family protein [Methanocella conradii]|uniref:RNA-guided endonuclease InsQ/TnpB family protein n=1 Tax=Methanocella conradii TaxID=1175444 RepID=UPI00157DC157|nr:RNA-guided endonuclease TnpB family protein [Methanocella conradii]